MAAQVKSKQRVIDYGEVFTNEREVKAMLDLVKEETERIESRFLEPACGNGNFLAEVIRRKLEVVKLRFSKKQLDYEFNAFIACTSIYGVDILADNAQECRQRLFDMVEKEYQELFGKKVKPEFLKSVWYILERNILVGDALDYTDPRTKKPIIFSEWTFPKEYHVLRKDFSYKFLVEKSLQYSLFNDEGDLVHYDRPLDKIYTPVHFLKIDTAYGSL